MGSSGFAPTKIRMSPGAGSAAQTSSEPVIQKAVASSRLAVATILSCLRDSIIALAAFSALSTEREACSENTPEFRKNLTPAHTTVTPSGKLAELLWEENVFQPAISKPTLSVAPSRLASKSRTAKVRTVVLENGFKNWPICPWSTMRGDTALSRFAAWASSAAARSLASAASLFACPARSFALAASLCASAILPSNARATDVSKAIFTSDWRFNSSSADCNFDWKKSSSISPITRRLNPSFVQIGRRPFSLNSTSSSCPSRMTPSITRIDATSRESLQNFSDIAPVDAAQKWREADDAYTLALRGERTRLLNRLFCVLIPAVWFMGYFVWSRARSRLGRK